MVEGYYHVPLHCLPQEITMPMLIPRSGGYISADVVRLEKDIKRIDPTLSLHIGTITDRKTKRVVDQRVELWRRVEGRLVYISAYTKDQLPTVISDIHKMRGTSLEDFIQRLEKADDDRHREAERLMQEGREAIQDNLRHLRRGNRRYTVVPEGTDKTQSATQGARHRGLFSHPQETT